MPNRLSGESSPYLQQHADNPVEWFPWGNEAFEVARKTGKPVLLSVGYSACHWCHVMAHESFEDESIAEVMNRLFVNVKVDREERPDVDKIYQTAHQLLTQRGGGWPLTMFLDGENQRPFFGGTYFPNEARHGMPAFAELLEKVAAFYSEQRDEVRAQSDQLLGIFEKLEPAPGDDAIEFTLAPLQAARVRRRYGYFRDGHSGLGCSRSWRRGPIGISSAATAPEHSIWTASSPRAWFAASRQIEASTPKTSKE